MGRLSVLALSFGALGVAAWPGLAASARPEAAACAYQLGFRTLHDLIPDVVGNCASNEYHNAENGDGLQDTANGLLVWRKADNWTAFTNGATTWINGPLGVQSRPNDQRFPWESAAPAPERPTATPIPSATPFPTATTAPTEEPSSDNDQPD